MARQTLWDLAAVVSECEYNFCDMARTLRMGENAFRRPRNFKELRCKKGTYYNLCVMCLLAAFVPHRPNKYFHVTASNGIVSSSPYTPLAKMLLAAHRQVRGSHRSIHCWHGHAARRSALPRERFSRVPGMLNSSEVKVFHPT